MKRWIMVVAVACVAAGTAACGSSPAPQTVGPAEAAAPQTEAARRELSFLVGMIPHHAQAVDMARLGLERSRDARVLGLCRAVAATQTREITSMRDWAVAWYATVPSEVVSALHSADGEAGEGGMLKDEAMASLGLLRGPAFDREFVRRMTAHHKGAVASARAIVGIAPHAEVRNLAQAIVAAQTAEIAEMVQWARTTG